ncbi:hypothetical protein ACQB6R_00590 [Propionibacteriaceae bacterium G1746]
MAVAYSAWGLPLSTIGLMQYIVPTMQFLIGVLVFGHQVSLGYWIGLVVVWAGCLVYISGLLSSRTRASGS